MSFSSNTALPVEISDLRTNTIKIFNSNVKAAKYLHVSDWTIRSYKNSKKLYKGYFKILDFNESKSDTHCK